MIFLLYISTDIDKTFVLEDFNGTVKVSIDIRISDYVFFLFINISNWNDLNEKNNHIM